MANKIQISLIQKSLALVLASIILAACGSVSNQSSYKPLVGISSSNTLGQVQSTSVAQGKVGGGIIGSQIGAGLDSASRDVGLAAEFNALENGRAGEAVKWSNGQTASGIVTPQQTYEVGSQTCRRYTHQILVNGESREASSTSCRQSSGTWQILS